MAKRKSKKRNGKQRPQGFRLFCIVAVCIIVAAVVSTVVIRGKRCVNSEPVRLFLPSTITYDALIDTLQHRGCITSREGFDAMASFRSYKDHVKGGSYIVEEEMPYFDLVNKLRSGSQDPIRIVIGRQRSLTTLCDNLGKRFEFSGKELYRLVTTDSICHAYGLSRATIMSLFIQNTYEVYWNIAPRAFLDRMYREYNHFWNASRIDRCKALNLTPAEVTTLAAIVEEETNYGKEKPLIASVYLNRIRRRMPLQADPTVRYAVGNFELRRILRVHTEINHPYNTYRIVGLPPGPICIPSAESIDAVLENKKTNYLYFCAKEDFSGSHNFASTLAEHQRNADKFHRALNNRKIYK